MYEDEVVKRQTEGDNEVPNRVVGRECIADTKYVAVFGVVGPREQLFLRHGATLTIVFGLSCELEA